jgi:hypothetical protein
MESLTHTPEVLPPADPDTSVLTSIGQDITQFFTVQLPAFLRGAAVVEQQALAAEAEAATLTLITDAARHQFVLERVKAWKEEKRAAEGYWDITTRFHRAHTLLTQRRGIATGALERAITKATSLSALWERQERQRVEAENRRRQEEADRKAREEQAAQAAKMEQEALEREAALESLSTRQQSFVGHILAGMAQGRAARLAGFQDAGYADTLLAMPKVQKAILAAQQARAIREQAEAVRQRPVTPQPIEQEVLQVGKVKGLRQTVTHKAVITDLAAWRKGIRDGTIPIEAAIPDEAVMNGFAKALGAKINAWPGTRYERHEGKAG